MKEYSRPFCKPRNASAGRGCFVVERQETNGAPSVYETEAGVVTEQSRCSCLLEAFALDDYLVQRFMTNHPALAGLCETKDAITVRIITEMQDLITVCVYCAMLEIPGPERDSEAGKEPLKYPTWPMSSRKVQTSFSWLPRGTHPHKKISPE